MSDIVTPRDLPDELTEIINPETLIEIYNPDSARNEKIEKGNFNIDGIRLSAGRISDKELISSSLASGDWNIAELEDVADGRATALFKIVDSGGTTTIEAGIKMSASAKTHANTTIVIKERSGSPLITNIDIGKSDSVDASGALIRITLSSASIITTELIGNTGSGAGFELITPNQLTDLPDGVTAATFLEAGEELSFLDDTLDVLRVRKFNDDVLFCTLNWPEIPKQGTGLTITYPSTSLSIIDRAGTVLAWTAGTISNFTITGRIINFRVTNIAAFASLVNGPVVLEAVGTGGKLTIT